MSKVERSKWSGGCAGEPVVGSRARSSGSAQSRNAATLACVISTPFGRPVDPEVKRMWAASPGPTSTAGAASGSVAIEPASKLVRNVSPSTGTSAVVAAASPRSTPPSATIPSRRAPRARMDDDEADVGRRDDPRGARGRAREVDRHVRAARLERPEHRGDRRRLLRQEEGDAVARPAAGSTSACAKRLREGLELAVT